MMAVAIRDDSLMLEKYTETAQEARHGKITNKHIPI
jgi:hypothetical protein